MFFFFFTPMAKNLKELRYERAINTRNMLKAIKANLDEMELYY